MSHIEYYDEDDYNDYPPEQAAHNAVLELSYIIELTVKDKNYFELDDDEWQIIVAANDILKEKINAEH